MDLCTYFCCYKLQKGEVEEKTKAVEYSKGIKFPPLIFGYKDTKRIHNIKMNPEKKDYFEGVGFKQIVQYHNSAV